MFSGVKFNSKTFLFSSLWPKNASKCLKIDFFGKLVNLGQTLTCRDSMGLQLIGLRDPSHLIIYQYVPHMSYAAIRKFLRGYHNHRMCNSVIMQKTKIMGIQISQMMKLNQAKGLLMPLTSLLVPKLT